MPRGDKSKYTNKQERQAEHIEEGYEDRGVGQKEAKRMAWSTVNKSSHGGKKPGGGGYGKKKIIQLKNQAKENRANKLARQEEKKMTEKGFVSDMETIRKQARQNIENGAITSGYKADKEAVIRVLNDALATELVCVLRYKYHHLMAKGINSEPVAAEFLQHANEEQMHADRIATRIVQLGGTPDLNPATLVKRSHSQYVQGDNLIEMIKEDLIAERIAIDTYRDIIKFLGEDDSTSRRLMEEILEKEEEHADDMANLLSQFSPSDNGRKSAK